MNLVHSEHPLRQVLEPSVLPGNVLDQIRLMLRVGGQRAQIIAAVYDLHGLTVTHSQLSDMAAEMRGIQHPVLDVSMTDELIAWADEQRPRYAVYTHTVRVGTTDSRCAIGIFSEDEVANANAMGDVLFMDGTNFPGMNNGWISVPVTALDQGRQLLSCGIFFVACETTEVWEFMITTVHDVSGGKFEVLVTDQSPAVMSAVAALAERDEAFKLRHRLCAWHKRRNIESAARRFGLSPAQIERVLICYDVVCYDPDPDIVEAHMAELCAFNDRFAEYIESELRPLLPLLTEAYRDGVFTTGSVSSQAAESANRFIGLWLADGVAHNLKEVRIALTRAYAVKGVEQVEANERRRVPVEATSCADLPLHPKIRAELELAIERAAFVNIEGPDGDGRYLATDLRRQRQFMIWGDEAEGGVTRVNCGCGVPSRCGYWCSHTAALWISRQLGRPDFMIFPRWYLTAPAVPPAAIDIRLWEREAAIAEDRRTRGASGDEDGGEESAPDGDGDQETEAVPKLAMRQSDYKIIVGLAANAARLATSLGLAADVSVRLKAMVDELAAMAASQTTADAVDHGPGPVRARGHSTQDKAPQHCDLCGGVGHVLRRCPHYHTLVDAVAIHHADSPGQEIVAGRHCSICGGAMHTKRTCAILALVQRRIAETIGVVT